MERVTTGVGGGVRFSFLDYKGEGGKDKNPISNQHNAADTKIVVCVYFSRKL